MVIDIPTGVYTMKVKRSIVKTNASKYRKISKKRNPLHLIQREDNGCHEFLSNL